MPPPGAEVPFRRVAISALPHHDQYTPQALEACLEAYVQWQQVALNRGADALLLRQRWPPLLLEAFLALLAQTECPRRYTLLVHGGAGLAWPVDGYHYPEAAAPPAEVLRRTYWLGQSTHSIEAALRAQARGLHYVFFSPVYETTSHPGVAGAGLQALADVCLHVQVPVFALGGLTPQREAECRAAGAYGVAAIGWFGG